MSKWRNSTSCPQCLAQRPRSSRECYREELFTSQVGSGTWNARVPCCVCGSRCESGRRQRPLQGSPLHGLPAQYDRIRESGSLEVLYRQQKSRAFLAVVVKAAHTLTKNNARRNLQSVFLVQMWSRLPGLDASSALTSSQRPNVKRICWLIFDNMCEIVEDPAAIIPVISKLEPVVKAACEKMSKLHDSHL